MSRLVVVVHSVESRGRHEVKMRVEPGGAMYLKKVEPNCAEWYESLLVS